MHEEAGTFTLLPGARGFHGLFGARADPVRYRAMRCDRPAYEAPFALLHARILSRVRDSKVLAFFVVSSSSQADLPTHPRTRPRIRA